MLRLLLLSFLLLFITHLFAIDVFEFDNESQKQQFKELSEELRCPVCQNQNLADSGSELSEDLRQEIYDQISEGKDNKEIVDFMVQRYGDFIIYRPQLKPINYLLWFGPIIILLAGFFIVYFQIKKQKNQTIELSSDEKQELDNMLNKLNYKKP